MRIREYSYSIGHSIFETYRRNKFAPRRIHPSKLRVPYQREINPSRDDLRPALNPPPEGTGKGGARRRRPRRRGSRGSRRAGVADWRAPVWTEAGGGGGFGGARNGRGRRCEAESFALRYGAGRACHTALDVGRSQIIIEYVWRARSRRPGPAYPTTLVISD